MASLKHAVWRDREGLPMCCSPGDGGAARVLNGEGATLVWTFEAGSHFEAMTAYDRHLERGEYTTSFEQDHRPYPDEWLERQRHSTHPRDVACVRLDPLRRRKPRNGCRLAVRSRRTASA